MQSRNLVYMPRIDHLRFIACLIVFSFHFFQYLSPNYEIFDMYPWTAIISEGHTGIGLFFTLSGFLFMLIALNSEKIIYKRFMLNRVLRIFPLFIFVFFVSISMNRDSFRAADIFYIFFSNMGNAPTSLNFITGPAWTISVEFTFYAAFPFIAAISREKGISYLATLIGLILLFKVGAYLQTDESIKIFYSTILGRFDQFLIGMIFAFFHINYSENLRRLSVNSVACAALIVGVNSSIQGYFYPLDFSELTHPMWIFWSIQESLGWGLFILVWINASFKIPRVIDRVMTRGGEISFSIYLMHAVVIVIFAEIFGKVQLTGLRDWDLLILGGITFGAVWVIAAASYETVEKPFLELRVKYS